MPITKLEWVWTNTSFLVGKCLSSDHYIKHRFALRSLMGYILFAFMKIYYVIGGFAFENH